MPCKVLMDTNLADNIDEAFALALAACSPEIELIGVTVLEPKAELLTRQLLGAYGRSKVPVSVGYQQAVTQNVSWYRYQASESYEGPISPLVPDKAPQFMAKKLEQNRKVTLIATAPLTNIAELLREYPQVEKNIEHLIFMGGWSSQALPEWNIQADPEAAETLFKAGIPITAVGYEVTLGCALQRHHFAQLKSAEASGPRLLSALCKAWLKGARSPDLVMHDPLTVALVCQPPLVCSSPAKVAIATTPGPSRGTIFLEPGMGKEIDLCYSVDTTAYLDFLLSRVALLPTSNALATVNPAKWYTEVWAAYETTYYPGWSLANHNSHHSLVLLLSGSCSIGIRGQEHLAEAGSAIYVPMNELYTVSTPKGMSVMWLLFDLYEKKPSLTLTQIPSIPGLPVHTATGPSSKVFNLLAKHVVELWSNPWSEDSLLCKANLLELLSKLISLAREQEIQSQSEMQIALLSAKWYIEANFQKDLSLDEISHHVGLSKYHFARSFKEEYGIAPLQYHLHLRMQQAKKLLELRHLTVTEVASLVGYSSVNAFSRAFRRELGAAPSEYLTAIELPH
ncbi:MAG: AraC family transcriptional regulator [Firmicutes bacterium]|nr:AraC family transcriptional regulator [Bacillota bacterium]